MAKFGLVELVKGAFKVGVKAPTLTASYDITLPAALPSSTQGVQRSSLGIESYFTPVANLALSTELDTLLNSSNTTGAFNLDLDSQAINLILASPVAAPGKPTFRSLVIGDFGATPPRLNNWSVPNAALDLNTQKIVNLADPTAAQDAVTKAYADSLIQGFSVKAPVRLATTANITLSGLQTIEGFPVLAGDRILVKNQTTASQNGIYDASTGAWTRSSDADGGTELSSAVFVFVKEGTINADTGWIITTDTPITIGTSAIAWTQFTGLGQVIAGTGLTKTGNQLDVGGTAGRIIANADNIDLVTTGVAAGTYNSLTVDTYGRVTAATAQAYSRVFRTAFTNANLTAGVLTAAHNLSQQFVKISVYDNTNKQILPDDVTATDANNMAVDLTNFGAIAGTWNLVICG